MRLMHVAALGVLTVSASAASAQFWAEIPDAPGTIPGQITVGPGPGAPLTAIIGTGDFSGDVVDAYCIYITDPTMFSATTVTPGTSFDTQLWLFDPAGMGVTFNDDVSATDVHSTITGLFVLSPGFYTLAITAYDTDPLNAAGAAIWADAPFTTERAPDGPGAPGPLAGWTTGPTLEGYKIFLTGATFHVVPAPGAVALLAIGGVMCVRRRRAV